MSDRVFEVEDTCILTEDVERDFGTVPKGTIIEIMEKYARQRWASITTRKHWRVVRVRLS